MNKNIILSTLLLFSFSIQTRDQSIEITTAEIQQIINIFQTYSRSLSHEAIFSYPPPSLPKGDISILEGYYDNALKELKKINNINDQEKQNAIVNVLIVEKNPLYAEYAKDFFASMQGERPEIPFCKKHYSKKYHDLN
jgi:hypothetical protein